MARKIASRKKKMPSIANRTPKTAAEPSHEGRPQEAELEREDRPGHGTDGERDRRRLRPALGERHRVGVVPAQATVVRDQHQRRQRNAE